VRALRVIDRKVVLADVDPPRPNDGEALIRVRRAGVCSTDLHIVRGYMGFEGTLGHELAGEVIECEDRSWIGRRVAGEINLGCGRCERCLRGMSRHCATRTVLGILGKDGCMAEYVTLPIVNLHVLPGTLSDDVAAFVEPLAAAYEILEQLHVAPGTRAVVLGDGKLGSLVATVLLQAGARVSVVGHHTHKLARLEALGAHIFYDERGEPIVPDGSCDLAVDATGSASGFDMARKALRPRGTLVMKSTFHGRKLEIDAASIIIDEITLVGSRCGPFAPAIDALASRKIDPSASIDEVIPLSDGVRAIERASSSGASKIVIACDG
jgi:threonine dehydrogenase-like Zn-dependent dehydrogenase